MGDPVEVLALVISVVLLLLVLELVRRRLLGEEYALLWIVAGMALLGLSLARGGLDALARWLGVSYGPAVLLLALGVVVFVGLLLVSVVISRQRVQIERLIEDLAILEARLRQVEQTQEDDEPGLAEEEAGR